MTVNFTTTQQKVVFTDTDGAVTFTAATAPVVFTAAIAGPQGDSHVKIVDWGIKRDTSNATTALDPIGDFANWEAAAPAYWNLSDGDRVGFNDRINPTQSGIYDYTAGVGFARTTDADTYDKLNGAVVVGKTFRNHADLTTVSGTPAYLELMAVFIPRTVDVIDVVEWDADWFVDRQSYSLALLYTQNRQPAVPVARGSYLGLTSNYTVPDDTSALLLFGTHGTVTMPVAANNSGKRFVLSAATNDVTISTQGSDAFLPAANTSFSISAGTTVSFYSLGTLPYWVVEMFSGRDVDIPFWFGGSIPDGKVVQMVSGGPAWSTVTGDEVEYTPAVGANWTGSAPTTIAQALDRIAAALGPIA